mgnify:CR=1 FL=1
MSATPKLIDTLEKKIKIECLIAFIHSRITGVMNDGTNVSLVFGILSIVLKVSSVVIPLIFHI